MTQDMPTLLQLPPQPHCLPTSAVSLLSLRQGMRGKVTIMSWCLRQCHKERHRTLSKRISMSRNRVGIHTTNMEDPPYQLRQHQEGAPQDVFSRAISVKAR